MRKTGAFLALLAMLLVSVRFSNAAETITPEMTLAEILRLPEFEVCGPYLFDQEYRHHRLELTLSQLQNRYAYCDASASARTLSTMAERIRAGTLSYLPISEETGLFHFQGPDQAPFAILCPGGGFRYVSALTEGFPLALTINAAGYHAFVLHYRTEQGEEAACDDLWSALQRVLENAEAWKVQPSQYALWGASAGGVMAATVGERAAPSAVVLQYTPYTAWTPDTPPTYGCVGTRDQLVNPELMRDRQSHLAEAGIPGILRIYEGVGHGFGLGVGTPAEGWAEEAIAFWRDAMQDACHPDN